MSRTCHQSRKTLLIRAIPLWIACAMMSSCAFADTTTQAPVSSTGSCPNVPAEINSGLQSIQQTIQPVYQAVPPPANLSSSTCFSNILNMGSSIGLSYFNPSTLIQQLSQMACNAAQQALQWPISQAENAINSNGSLPYGLGGVSVGNGAPGVSVNTYSASGPALPAVPSAGNLLSNALGG